MANFETKLGVGDVVIMANYINEIGAGIVKEINVTSKGIAYEVQVGFNQAKSERIFLREVPTCAACYRLIAKVGNVNELGETH